MSHEMRTPLATCVYFLQQIMLLLNSPPPLVLRYLQLLLSQLTFTQSFVEDLLDYRQLKDGVFSLLNEPFDPNTIIKLVISIFKTQVDSRRLEITHTVETDLKLPRGQESPDPHQLRHLSERDHDQAESSRLPTLIGDKRRFKQILINLVKNAIKFTQNGSIKLKSQYNYDIGCLVLHVEDTGSGIAPEDLSLLFNRFGKLHRTASMNNDGIGLGLTIVKQIVETSRGFIDVESEGINQGSTFFLTMEMKVASQIYGMIGDNNDNLFDAI